MPFRGQQSIDGSHVGSLVALCHATGQRHRNAEKHVALAILALACLEKAAQHAALLLVAETAQLGHYRVVIAHFALCQEII